MKKPTSRYTFPYITIEQATAYDPAKPETATDSLLVNAVIEAFFTVRPLTPRNIAESLGLANLDLAGGLKCATGLSLVKLLDEWRTHKLLNLTEEEREQRSDEIAHQLGFYDRSSLWEFMKRRKLIKCLKKGAWHELGVYENSVFTSKKKQRL